MDETEICLEQKNGRCFQYDVWRRGCVNGPHVQIRQDRDLFAMHTVFFDVSAGRILNQFIQRFGKDDGEHCFVIS